ncbi:hypothetical protein R3P38DRAFT_3246057 [Favolaschia claudopus]|uniref:Uncharacterized protein n=1 Tax=Favolaschia claudopus TaxID=2862362 RepID=A0AAV9YZS2_9AGAR
MLISSEFNTSRDDAVLLGHLSDAVGNQWIIYVACQRTTLPSHPQRFLLPNHHHLPLFPLISPSITAFSLQDKQYFDALDLAAFPFLPFKLGGLHRWRVGLLAVRCLRGGLSLLPRRRPHVKPVTCSTLWRLIPVLVLLASVMLVPDAAANIMQPRGLSTTFPDAASDTAVPATIPSSSPPLMTVPRPPDSPYREHWSISLSGGYEGKSKADGAVELEE